jgi:CBS domain-containing protein
MMFERAPYRIFLVKQWFISNAARDNRENSFNQSDLTATLARRPNMFVHENMNVHEFVTHYVREVMTHHVKIASPEDTLRHAAQMMDEIDCGVLPVAENDRLVGMLTDRDITVRAVAQGRSPDRCKVREVMSTEIKYMYDDESVADATRNMSDLQVRRLPVLDRNKRLVGIVSLGDLAISHTARAATALKHVSL